MINHITIREKKAIYLISLLEDPEFVRKIFSDGKPKSFEEILKKWEVYDIERKLRSPAPAVGGP